MIVSRLSIPISFAIARLNRRTPSAAIRAPEGCGVEDDSVAGGKHVDGVAGEGGEAVGDGRDGADHAEGGVVGERQAAIAGGVVGAEVLHAGDRGDRDVQLRDLVIEPADLGLFEFLATEFLSLLEADPLDELDGTVAVAERSAAEGLKGRLGGGDGGLDG